MHDIDSNYCFNNVEIILTLLPFTHTEPYLFNYSD